MAPEKSKSSSKEKILQIKRNTLKIVELCLLDENISREWFLENCVKLCQADYDDVVQERSISLLCGYPICSKPIKKIIKQQYKISRAENKVYDITERKNFCSNECYKASNFLKVQLHSLPLWMRKPEKSSLELKLLLDSENKGSAGEELLFRHSVSKAEVEQSFQNVAEPIETMNLTNMLQEDIKDCTEHLQGLNIKENVYQKKYVFNGENVDDPEDSDEDTLSDSQSLNSEDDDKPSFPEYGNISALSTKHMPTVMGKSKKAVLIPQLHAPQEPTLKTKLPIDAIVNIFQDWYTEDTLKYLLGERQLYSFKANHLFKTLVHSTDSVENLSTVKEEYVNLCMKIDKLPEEEDEIDDDFETDICDTKPVKESVMKQNKLEKLASEIDSKLELNKPNLKKKVKRRSPGKGKSVSFASGTKPSKANILPEECDTSLPEPTLPLIDSISQNARRKQILIGNLKNMYIKILPVIDVRYNVIQKEVADLVDTFSLTPTNTVLKPREMKCVAVVIFRILTKTKIKDLHQDVEFSKLCENVLISLNISLTEVENLVKDLIDPNQVLKL